MGELLELLLAVLGGAIGGFIVVVIMRIRSAPRPIYPVSWSIPRRYQCQHGVDWRSIYPCVECQRLLGD